MQKYVLQTMLQRKSSKLNLRAMLPMATPILIAGLCFGLLAVSASAADIYLGKTIMLKGNGKGATAWMGRAMQLRVFPVWPA